MLILKIFLVFSLAFSLQVAMAEEVWITISESMEEVIFDGKWTFHSEWKQSSLNDFLQDGYYLRSAHQGNFIYFLIDFVGDENLDNGKDKAMICLNPKENLLPNEQFCFISTLETDNSSIIKRTSDFENFKEIEKPDNFIALGSASDENDRYSKTPHSSYEFKIPTELVGRSNEYGFYIAIYEANSAKTITFPSQVESTTFDMIPDTSNWAKLVSPDKSLPEFHWIIVVVISSFTFVIFLSRSRIINKY